MNEIKEFIFPIESDLLDIDKQYGYDLIENIINKINNESFIINNNSKKYIISLKSCENDNNKKKFYIKNYELRFCNKKNMKPKNDLPAFSLCNILKNISDERISFISKYSLNIMLIEKFEDNITKKNILEEDDENNENKNIKIIKKNNNYENDKMCKCMNSCIII